MIQIQDKIITFAALAPWEEENIALCHGHFNILHPGHIRYLEYARRQGSKLVVTVLGDSTFQKSNRAHCFSERDRALGIASLHFVDQVVMLGENSLQDAIAKLRPRHLVVGKEFEIQYYDRIQAAAELLHSLDGSVLYHAGETQYATSELLRSNTIDLQEEKLRAFRQACQRQGLEHAALRQAIEKFGETSLLVLGDVIVDQYVACEALGMSAEAPVVVVRELEAREYAGGAGIVASHAHALGANCHFLSVVGADDKAEFASVELQQQGVECHLIEDSTRPTTYKTRYMVENQKMFRVSRLQEHSLPRTIEKKVIFEIDRLAPLVDGILVSDFVYGVVTQQVLTAVASAAEKHDLKLFGDLQCSSQIGNVAKFKNFDLLCPTEREARLALDCKEEGIEWVANALIEKTNARNLAMKLGAEGFIAYAAEEDGFINRQHFPALTVNPLDMAGAGDSLLAAISVGLCSGASPMLASALGVCVASLAVQTLGNLPVSRDQLREHLTDFAFEA